MKTRLLLLLACLYSPLGTLRAVPAAIERLPEGIVVTRPDGLLKLEVCAEGIVRVAFAADRAFFTRESLMLDPKRAPNTAAWSVTEDAATVTLKTSRLQVRVDRQTGAVAFFDSAGQSIVAERAGGRSVVPAEVQGETTAHVRQVWAATPGETLHGLGQHQNGRMDVKGWDVELWQHNTVIAIPFLTSNRGYGILWDNNSHTRFGDLRQPEFIPGERLFDAAGRPGGLTASFYAGRNFDRLVATRVDAKIDLGPPPETVSVGQIPAGETAASAAAVAADPSQQLNTWVHPALDVAGPISVRWEGSIEAGQTGEHLIETFANSGLKVWIDGRLVIDHWRQGWLPWYERIHAAFTAGQRHALRIEWVRDDKPTHLRLKWKTPSPSVDTSLWSEVGDGTDYYFVYGPSLDAVVAGYRQLTGAATLLPKWAFGLWQSRQRYETQQQSLDVAAEFRRRQIPFDVIVQDWFYWPADAWGSHTFDPVRFPDPDSWIRALHDQHHAKLLLSVWPKFYPGTANFEAFQKKGWLYEPNQTQGIRDWLGYPYTFYDAFNPAARRLFWEQMEPALFRRGVDAWWLDGSEPDLLPSPSLSGAHEYMMPTAARTAARVLNAFPLENSRAVYEGQRSSAPDQRVVILTRSGFAGQQRFAGAVWSGDISSTWTAMAKQIPAALGYALSGMPYWSMDSGGFSVPERFSTDNPTPADLEDWRELNTRWFQFATFVPLLRSHGEKPFREMWHFGGDEHPAYRTQLKFDRLRYRLLPYIYSLAGAVTHEGGSFLRPLVMDFPSDAQACTIADQYLFGPALLVNPVTQPQARSRAVYLPATSGGWYDFWSGANTAGGQTLEAPAPYEALPLYVRAGSILPFGPDLQYAMEKPADPVTLHVYAGADGSFTLYEDDGATYGYERGECSRIPLRWDEAARTLTIGARTGSFPGMLQERTFRVVLISPNHPVGYDSGSAEGSTLRYNGESTTVKF